MINNERADILEEELLLVRHSGEIPEVALHSSLHFLCDDLEGPGLILSDEELTLLQHAALARYREIVLRDLDTANRDLPLFRGIRRALHNWYRLARFSNTINCSIEDFRAIAAKALLTYLRQELEEVCCGKRAPSVNCSSEALNTFAITLGIDLTTLSGDWTRLCEKTM